MKTVKDSDKKISTTIHVTFLSKDIKNPIYNDTINNQDFINDLEMIETGEIKQGKKNWKVER